jgi:hypothetical protein
MNVKTDRKNKMILLKVSEKEREEIKAMAKKHGFVSVSEFVRKASLMQLGKSHVSA